MTPAAPPSAETVWLRIGYTFETTAMLSFGFVSAIAMAARSPAPPPPTSSTSCIGFMAALNLCAKPSQHQRVRCELRWRERPNPDIAESHRITVVLQHHGEAIRMRNVWIPTLIRRRAQQRIVVLHHDPIVEDRHPRGRRDCPGGREPRRAED